MTRIVAARKEPINNRVSNTRRMKIAGGTETLNSRIISYRWTTTRQFPIITTHFLRLLLPKTYGHAHASHILTMKLTTLRREGVRFNGIDTGLRGRLETIS